MVASATNTAVKPTANNEKQAEPGIMGSYI